MSKGHNLVILEQEADEKAFVEAAMNAPVTEYVPVEMSDVIIAHTKLLGPGESDTITFKAPTKKGRYVFLCSFPGHYQIGMKGYMVVR
jgi:azurin